MAAYIRAIQGVVSDGYPLLGCYVLVQRVLQTELEDALAESSIGGAERRWLRAPDSTRCARAIRASDHLSEVVEVRRQILVVRGVTTVERQEGGIEEVKGREPELQFLTFADLEVFQGGSDPNSRTWGLGCRASRGFRSARSLGQ